MIVNIFLFYTLLARSNLMVPNLGYSDEEGGPASTGDPYFLDQVEG